MLPHTIPQVGRTCDIIPQNMKHHNMTRTCYVPQCIVHTAIVTVLCADHRSIGGGGNSDQQSTSNTQRPCRKERNASAMLQQRQSTLSLPVPSQARPSFQTNKKSTSPQSERLQAPQEQGFMASSRTCCISSHLSPHSHRCPLNQRHQIAAHPVESWDEPPSVLHSAKLRKPQAKLTDAIPFY